jgi:hypothetical protein
VQGLVVNRFAQEQADAEFAGKLASFVVVPRRDRDHRQPVASRIELAKQFKAAHSRHGDIQDDAGMVGVLHLRKKVLGTVVGQAFDTRRAHQSRQALADGLIVVDDVHQKMCCLEWHVEVLRPHIS